MAATDHLRDCTTDELEGRVRAARLTLFGLRFQHAGGELENTAGLKSAKRELARTLTVTRERGIDPEKIR